MDVTTKSLGLIIDDLITTSNKMWHLQDQADTEGISDHDVAEIMRKIQKLNVRRNALINAIDEKLDQNTFSTTEKTYH